MGGANASDVLTKAFGIPCLPWARGEAEERRVALSRGVVCVWSWGRREPWERDPRDPVSLSSLGVAVLKLELFMGRGRPPPLRVPIPGPLPSAPAPQRRIEWGTVRGPPTVARDLIPRSSLLVERLEVLHSKIRLSQHFLNSTMRVSLRLLFGTPVCARVADVAANTST